MKPMGKTQIDLKSLTGTDSMERFAGATCGNFAEVEESNTDVLFLRLDGEKMGQGVLAQFAS